MLETKLNKKIYKILVIIMSAGIVLFNAVPTFASSANVGTIDSDAIPNANMSAKIETVTQYYVGDNTNEMRLPVYLNFSNLTTIQSYEYLSGYVLYGANNNVFGIYTNTPVNVVKAYFQSVDNPSIRAVWKDGNSLRVYFDNFRVTGYANSAGYVYIGDMVYTFDSVPTGFMYVVPTSATGVLTSTGYMRGSAYEYGFANSIVYAINSATTMQDILSILNSIDQSTGYLADILAELQDTHTELYYLLAQIWNTDTAVLSVDRDIYTTVLSIFALLNNAYAPQESHVEEVADNIEQNMSNLAHDIELTKPSAVADIADDYISQIDTSYNTSIFGALFNPVIILMLCVVFAFAILSYMLYGGS